jgi:hypothetical protein
MKHNFLKAAVLVVFVFTGLTAFGRSFKTGSSNAEITPVDNLFPGKNVEKVWTISYDNGQKPLTVTLLKTNKYPTFVVRSQFFEVVYASDERGFGVKKVASSERSVNKRMTNAVLNNDQLQKQCVLTPNKVSEEYALGLIASYLPDLLNNGYKHLIY